MASSGSITCSLKTTTHDFQGGNHPTQTTLTPCNDTIFNDSIGGGCVDMAGKSTAMMNNKVGTPPSPTATNVPIICTSQDMKTTGWSLSWMMTGRTT